MRAEPRPQPSEIVERVHVIDEIRARRAPSTVRARRSAPRFPVRRAVGRGSDRRRRARSSSRPPRDEREAVVGNRAREREQVARAGARQVGVHDEVRGRQCGCRCRVEPRLRPRLPDPGEDPRRESRAPARSYPPGRRRAHGRPPSRRRRRPRASPRRGHGAPDRRRPGAVSDRSRGTGQRWWPCVEDTTEVAQPENATLAERLEALASLLELSGASFYSVRAYRRAAELIRSTPAVGRGPRPRTGASASSPASAASIEARLRELVETGRLAELDELEASVRPELVGLARLVGLVADAPRRDRQRPRRVERRPSCARRRRRSGCAKLAGIGPATEAKDPRRARPAAARTAPRAHAEPCARAHGSIAEKPRRPRRRRCAPLLRPVARARGRRGEQRRRRT